MASREEQIRIANFLQETLGDAYQVRYDDCESGLTRVYFKPLNLMTAEVQNSELHAGISTSRFLADREHIYKAMALNLM